MFFWFERGGEYLRCEVHAVATDRYELRVITPDGTVHIEQFSDVVLAVHVRAATIEGGPMRFAGVALFVSFAVLGSACATVYKVERSEYGGSQGIPAGHLPPPGSCRVWYSDRPAGQQPPPTNCRDAERTAAGERGARVIYSQSR